MEEVFIVFVVRVSLGLIGICGGGAGKPHITSTLIIEV